MLKIIYYDKDKNKNVIKFTKMIVVKNNMIYFSCGNHPYCIDLSYLKKVEN